MKAQVCKLKYINGVKLLFVCFEKVAMSFTDFYFVKKYMIP